MIRTHYAWLRAWAVDAAYALAGFVLAGVIIAGIAYAAWKLGWAILLGIV